MVGLPFPNKGSPELIEKMNYLDNVKKSNLNPVSLDLSALYTIDLTCKLGFVYQ
jgi:Rad3-related DNA helicase